MSYLNSTDCICGHAWSGHLIDNKLAACSFNQKVCDCWVYQVKKVDRCEIVDLQIELNDLTKVQ